MTAITQHLQQRAPLAVSVFLSLAFVIFAFSATQQWYSDWALTHQAVAESQTLGTQDQTQEMIAALPNAHLFGQAITHSSDVPITNLELRVTGIVKIADEEASSYASKAYISLSGQPSKIFQVGDSLPYGAKVYAINSDTVILENEGRLEKLPLPREALQFKYRNVKGS